MPLTGVKASGAPLATLWHRSLCEPCTVEIAMPFLVEADAENIDSNAVELALRAGIPRQWSIWRIQAVNARLHLHVGHPVDRSGRSRGLSSHARSGRAGKIRSCGGCGASSTLGPAHPHRPRRELPPVLRARASVATPSKLL